MSTLILSPRYTDDSRIMRSAAVRAGWNVHRLGGWRAPEQLVGAEAAVYGEPLFAEVVSAQVGLALMDPPASWLPGLPRHHLHREVRTATLGAARDCATPVFVKPADGRKGFEGAVYDRGAGLPPAETCPDDTAVLIAEPVRWDVEFRCFVREGEVLTMSPYWRAGELAMAEDGSWPASETELAAAHAYAKTVVAEVPLPPAVVLDIGVIEERGWAVVEANSAWGAGVYGCDPDRVLEVLARACVPRSRLTAEDEQWALEAMAVDE
ncbi:ATP-grasp domain-containing protein [Nocardia sp. NPDC050406]|uniref:ATP-grasp domain-containing protein n=1 Tax=Nocardia sp. NPDC050406 TaxID=3364318 RepID=UPI0037BCAC1B